MATIRSIINGFLGLKKDPNATTQDVAVIKAEDTNAGLVLKPNGTGAIMAQVPDGTATGGNARGANSVDLQTNRTSNLEIASGASSVVVGGLGNRATGNYSSVLGGFQNRASSSWGSVVGGQYNLAQGSYSFTGGGTSNNSSSTASTISGGESNTASSTHSTISGGQSNTVSTGTHATVVGGYQNTASGQYSVAGGNNNVASGLQSVAGGYFNTASNNRTVALGDNNNVSGIGSVAVGSTATITGTYSGALGGRFARINSSNSVVLGGNLALSYLYNQLVTNSSSGTVDWGDTQSSQLLSYKTASLSSAATTVLSLDGTGTTNLIIPYGNNRAWMTTVKWVAIVTAITGTATGVTVGDAIYGTSEFGFKRLSGTSSITSLIRDSIVADTAIMETATLTYSAGASQELALTFTAPTFSGGGDLTVRVVAKVELTEVAF